MSEARPESAPDDLVLGFNGLEIRLGIITINRGKNRDSD